MAAYNKAAETVGAVGRKCGSCFRVVQAGQMVDTKGGSTAYPKFVYHADGKCPARGSASDVLAARYAGRCACGCERAYSPGTEIRKASAGWVIAAAHDVDATDALGQGVDDMRIGYDGPEME